MFQKIKDFFMLTEGNGTAFYYGTILFTILNYVMPMSAAFVGNFFVFMGREAIRWKTERKIHYKTIFLGSLAGMFCSMEPALVPLLGDAFPFIKDAIGGFLESVMPF